MNYPMSMLSDIYVKMIEGTECWVPVKARKVADDQYEIDDCPEFDPEDSSTLIEYLAGDVVKVAGNRAIALISTPQTDERFYWWFLFQVTDKGDISSADKSSPFYDFVISRVTDEIEQKTRYHYPAILDWITRRKR